MKTFAFWKPGFASAGWTSWRGGFAPLAPRRNTFHHVQILDGNFENFGRRALLEWLVRFLVGYKSRRPLPTGIVCWDPSGVPIGPQGALWGARGASSGGLLMLALCGCSVWLLCLLVRVQFLETSAHLNDFVCGGSCGPLGPRCRSSAPRRDQGPSGPQGQPQKQYR